MFRIKGHREAGNGLPATEWPLLAAAGQPAEFHTREEAERLVSMCNAALAHSPARITYAVEEAPAPDDDCMSTRSIRARMDYQEEQRRRMIPITSSQRAQPLLPRHGDLVVDYSPIYAEEWPADDTGAPLTT